MTNEEFVIRNYQTVRMENLKIQSVNIKIIKKLKVKLENVEM